MGKSRFKIINKMQFFEIVWKGEWKTFVDSVIKEGRCVLNTKKINGYTLLSCATQYGHKGIVDYLMQNGANCNASNFDGSIPLHVAAKHKHKDLLELFAISSVCVDSRDNMGRTALHYVTDVFHKDTENPLSWLKKYCHKNLMHLVSCNIEDEHMELATLLLHHGADIDASDNGGNVPLLLAEKHACSRVVEMLIMGGANVKFCKDNTWTMLHNASSRGWLRVVQLLVERKVDLNAETIRGDTALLLAVTNSRVEIAELLIKSGANVNGRGFLNTSVLHYASQKGWLNVVKLLVERRVNVNAETVRGDTALLLAVMNSRVEIAELLIKSGANVNGRGFLNTSVLHYASQKGWLNVVKLLVERRVNVNAETVRGDTALLLAVMNSHVEIAELLIKSGANVNGRGFLNMTALHYASEKGWLNIVKLLVEYKADINVSTYSGATPVMLAVKHIHRDIFDFLVKHGADLVGTYEGNTILHFACCTGWSDVVQSFVDRGHDIDAQTSKGETPLLIAARHFSKEIVDILIKSGANLHICNPNAIFLVHYVCKNDWVDVFQNLVDAGLDINTTYPDGRTFLMDLTNSCEGLKIFDYLLEAGADIEVKKSCEYNIFKVPNMVSDASNDDLTVLYYASYLGRLEMVLSLISKGADVNVSNSAGKTPLYAAVRNEYTDIVKHLLDAGANANVKTLEGQSPLYVAVFMENLEIVMHLVDAGADVNAGTHGTTPLYYLDMECMEIATYLLKAGADCNADNGQGTAFECYVEQESDVEAFPIFIENGAYITNDIYDILRYNSHFKEGILKNVELCTQAVLNKFNNLDLHQIYQVPFAVKYLPPIKGMKIRGDGYVAQCIENSVIRDIETNGYCNITKIPRPIVLRLLSVEAFIKHYIMDPNI